MKTHDSRSVFLLTLWLVTYSAWAETAWAETRVSKEAPASSSASITIPGPLRSFLRMAGISQKVSAEEVLPLLAHSLAMQWPQERGKPTEYLILLERYVAQARRLRELAGPDGVIRVSNCSDAEPLLTTLGYRLRGPCGASTFIETANPREAFLTVDSGFPLVDLEQALQRGNPFTCLYPSSQVPVLFSQTDWTSNTRNRGHDVIDVLLRDPALARLYWALSQIDENTRSVLRQSMGLDKLAHHAAVLDFYGSHINIRSGRVVVPGGAPAESAWKSLVGASPGSPGAFIIGLLTKDAGWLTAYFDTLSRVNSTQQAYFTEPHRLRGFYEALRGQGPSPGPAKPVFRPAPGLLLLATQLQLEPTGQPHVPGNLEFWKEFLGQKTNSKLLAGWTKRTHGWNTPDQLMDAMFALARAYDDEGPLQVYLTLNEIDRRRSPREPLSPQTVRLLASKFSRFSDQYLIFSEFRDLNDDSIARFFSVAEAIDRIPEPEVRSDTLGIFQANVGLWQILARQMQIPTEYRNQSWQRAIFPFVGVHSSAQLFDAARDSLGELLRAVAGKPRLSQDEIIALLAGPKQTSPEGRQVRRELADKIRGVMDAQRLVSLDTLFALGDSLSQLAHGKPKAEGLLPLAGELQEFELPKPLFTTGERIEWAHGLYTTPHILAELQTNLAGMIKLHPSAEGLTAARGQLTHFLRDSLVGLNYAYYEPPAAQMLLNNPLFVRAHEFCGEEPLGGERSWQTPRLYGRGSAASGGAHLAGSLADLPYILALVEQNFIAPESVQSLIWEDLVPSFLAGAVLPRWWGVTRNELHAVALYQRLGEELLAAAEKDQRLRETAMGILSDRLLPQQSEKVAADLQGGQSEAAVAQLAPGEVFFLAAEFRRRFPKESHNWGKAGQDLDTLAQHYPDEVSLERLSEDFGVPHPALERTYARELLNVKPFPTFMGYSSRLMAESWDSNNLFWARLADESGYPPVMLHHLVPELTRRMIEKMFATHLEDWPALLRALRETGEEFRQGKLASLPNGSVTSPL